MTELLRVRLHIFGGSQSLQMQICDLATLAGVDYVCFNSNGIPSKTLSTPTRFASLPNSQLNSMDASHASARDSSAHKIINVICDQHSDASSRASQQGPIEVMQNTDKPEHRLPRINVHERYQGLTKPNDIVLPGDEVAFLTRLELLTCMLMPRQYHFVTVDNTNLTTILSLAFLDYLGRTMRDDSIAWMQTSPLSGQFKHWAVRNQLDWLHEAQYASVLNIAVEQNRDQSMLLSHSLRQQMLRKDNTYFLPWGSFADDTPKSDSNRDNDDDVGKFADTTASSRSKDDLHTPVNATQLIGALHAIKGTIISHWDAIVTDEGYFCTDNLRIHHDATLVVVFSRTTQSFMYIEQIVHALRHIRDKVLVHYPSAQISAKDVSLYADQYGYREIKLERVNRSRLREWATKPQRLSPVCKQIVAHHHLPGNLGGNHSSYSRFVKGVT